MNDKPEVGTGAEEVVSTEILEKGEKETTEEVVSEEVVEEKEEVLEEKKEEVVEEKKEEPVKVDAETRVQEALKAAREANERALKLEKEFAEAKAVLEQKAKPFDDLTLEQVSSVITNAKAEIEQLEAEGNVVAAELAKHNLTDYINYVKSNEEKRKKYNEEQAKIKAAKEAAEKDRADMAEAAEFYREKMGYPQDAFDAAGQQLAQYFEANPIKGREFGEMIVQRKFVAAIGFADKVFHEEILPKLEAAKKKKEEGKKVSIMSSGNSSTVVRERTLAEIAEKGTMEEYIAARTKKK